MLRSANETATSKTAQVEHLAQQSQGAMLRIEDLERFRSSLEAQAAHFMARHHDIVEGMKTEFQAQIRTAESVVGAERRSAAAHADELRNSFAKASSEASNKLNSLSAAGRQEAEKSQRLEARLARHSFESEAREEQYVKKQGSRSELKLTPSGPSLLIHSVWSINWKMPTLMPRRPLS
jgi:hypothetical protein